MIPSQLSGPAYVLGDLEGPAARVGFWAKMAAALGATQLIIGSSCIVFHIIAFFMDQNAEQQLHYMGEGILTGGVVSPVRPNARCTRVFNKIVFIAFRWLECLFQTLLLISKLCCRLQVIFAGILGIASSKKKTNCTVSTEDHSQHSVFDYCKFWPSGERGWLCFDRSSGFWCCQCWQVCSLCFRWFSE